MLRSTLSGCGDTVVNPDGSTSIDFSNCSSQQSQALIDSGIPLFTSAQTGYASGTSTPLPSAPANTWWPSYGASTNSSSPVMLAAIVAGAVAFLIAWGMNR